MGVPVVAFSARGVDDLLAAGGGTIVKDRSIRSAVAAIETFATSQATYAGARNLALAEARRHDTLVITPFIVDQLDGLRTVLQKGEGLP